MNRVLCAAMLAGAAACAIAAPQNKPAEVVLEQPDHCERHPGRDERAALLDQLAEDEKGLVTTIVKKLLGDTASVFVDTDKARQVLLEEAS